ncbi:3-phosphoshikimate 1-carboxyvinyltransferase [termite gut metagenome]|uniref:3-phosphoshikimate 1-carboxyvinyltransferase n=1 Tax=termite gut metagenome TaxID=433724 RepID=A0A5J4QUI0_9ZZZZ
MMSAVYQTLKLFHAFGHVVCQIGIHIVIIFNGVRRPCFSLYNTGLQSLKIKETDRMTALIAELGKLGYVLREENGTTLVWNGERQEAQPFPVIKTYEDHRMAMAFAPVAIRYPNVKIADPQVVSKSYPKYWEDLGKAGVLVSVELPIILI